MAARWKRTRKTKYFSLLFFFFCSASSTSSQRRGTREGIRLFRLFRCNARLLLHVEPRNVSTIDRLRSFRKIVVRIHDFFHQFSIRVIIVNGISHRFYINFFLLSRFNNLCTTENWIPFRAINYTLVAINFTQSGNL